MGLTTRNRNTIEFLGIWEQLLVLANIESLNAEFIQMGLAQGDRLQKLNTVAIRQVRLLTCPVTRGLEPSTSRSWLRCPVRRLAAAVSSRGPNPQD
jgi:hypothetical protein